MTDKYHQAYDGIFIRAISAIPGLKYGGIDVIAEDITLPPSESNYIISEIEFSPGPSANWPTQGSPKNIAEPILGYYLKNKGQFINNRL